VPTAALICISLVIRDAHHLFMGLGAIVFLLGRNVYSSPLPGFESDCFVIVADVPCGF
jgi:hypothetical protein